MNSFCTACKKHQANPSRLRDHFAKNHPEQQFEEIDEETYRRDHLLEAYHCTVCDRLFSSSFAKKRHAKMHERQRMELPKMTPEDLAVPTKFEYVCTLSVCRNLDTNQIFLRHHSR